MNNKVLTIALLFSSLSTYLHAQTAESNPLSQGKKLNYENVFDQKGLVFYEQRIHRNPYKALRDAPKLVGDSLNQNVYVPLFNGMPIGKYGLKNNITYSPLTSAERSAYFRRMNYFIQNRYKLDFWIQPYFTANFGNFDKPVESNTSIALQTQLYLLPGLTIQTGILFPILNDLDGRPKNIRLAPTYLNQFYATNHHFLSASLGLFANDQYGLNLQYRHANLTKPWSFGVEAGLTGFYYYPKGGIYYEDPDQLLLLADVAYRFKSSDITLKLSGGQFLWKDKGVRFEMVRQFTNVEIGLYMMKTTNGSTLGFNFAIPIPPGKLAQSKKMRIRTTDEFKWEYNYTRGYRIGERYRMGYQLDQKLRQFHSDYLNGQRGY